MKLFSKAAIAVACFFSLSMAQDVNTTLWDAVVNSDIDQVSAAIAEGADVNASQSVMVNYGPVTQWPLTVALLDDNIEIAEVLVKAGADVNSKNDTASVLYSLLLASINDDTKVESLEYLADKGADLNYKSFDGSTPLHQAVYSRKADMVTYLVANGADMSAVTTDGYKIGPMAINNYNSSFDDTDKAKSLEVITALVKGGIDTTSMIERCNFWGGMEDVIALIESNAK